MIIFSFQLFLFFMFCDYSVWVSAIIYKLLWLNKGIIFLCQLQTFDLDAPHNTLEEISDGVAMAQALNQM
jgi:hypothetical protein